MKLTGRSARAALGYIREQDKQMEIATHPVQTGHQGGKAPQAVTMRAYEVYCHVYAPQEAMVTGGCRGGFSAGELVAFLYAHSFQKDEWRRRVDEAFKGMEGFK